MKKDPGSFSCENCEQSYPKWTDLKNMQISFITFAWTMEHIGTQLKRHIKSAHKDIRYPCDKSFTDRSNLQRHIKSDHINLHYLCDKFGKSFTDQGNLQRHIKSDHKNIQYPCDEKSFNDQGNLQRHIKSDHINIK